MNSRIALAGVLTLALLVTVGALGYKVTRQFLRYRAGENLYKEVYQSPFERSGTDQIAADIERLRKATEELGGDRIEAMLVDRLAQAVWFFPDEANPRLEEIFERAPRVAESPDGCPLVRASGYLLLWAYQVAVLPDLIEEGADVAIARRPDLRTSIRNLQAYSRLMSDDLEGVRLLATKELEARGGASDARAMALSCHVLLGEFDEAQKQASSFNAQQVRDVNLQLSYADLLIQQGKFREAREIAEMIVSRNAGSELFGILAVPLYYLEGPNSGLTRDAIKAMTKSTRNPLSEAGAEAWVAGRLYEITGEDKYTQRMSSLSSQYVNDYDVWAAQADSFMNRAMWQEAGQLNLGESGVAASGGPNKKENGTPSTPRDTRPSKALTLARRAAEAAVTTAQKMHSHILLARAMLYTQTGKSESEVKEQVIEHFQQCLATGRGENGEAASRVPDYDILLTDRRLQELREADREFSEELHSVVEDYLANRSEYFAAAIDAGEMSRLEYLAGQQPKP